MNEYKGRPFAVIGVNNDEEIRSAKYAVEKYSINWRSFFDPERKIADQFEVDGGTRGWPTILLIDPDGVIQYEYKAGETDSLDAKIKEMVTAAENKASE